MSKEKRRVYEVGHGPYQRDFISLEEGWFVICHMFYEDGTEEYIITDRFPDTSEGETNANEVMMRMNKEWGKYQGWTD